MAKGQQKKNQPWHIILAFDLTALVFNDPWMIDYLDVQSNSR